MQVLARPRDLQLPDTARPDTQEGVITRLHVVGHETRLEVRRDAQPPLEVYLPKTRAAALRAGQTVHVAAERTATFRPG